MVAITSADLIADIQRVHATTGKSSRRNYIRFGSYSERQVRKLFDNFSSLQKAAGLVQSIDNTVPTPNGSKVLVGESNEYVGDKWNYSGILSIHTLADLKKHFAVDEEVWDCERFVANSWEMGSGGGSKIPLYQVKATFVKRKAVAFAKTEIEDIKRRALDELRNGVISPRPLVYRETRLASGNLLELNVPDLHAGKLAWNKETGYGNYDTNIALDLFDTAIAALLERSAHITFDRILFVVGNDLQHADTIGGTTTSGTQLDTDSRYHKVFVKIRERLVQIIRNRLLPVAPVTIVGCPGNHDKTTAWHMVDSLEQRFYDNPDIEVLNDPTEFKVYQWGEVMLMFAHGNTGKKPDYPLTMATRFKEVWGNTTYREAHTGHIHQTMVQEFHGVRVRTLPALCEPDAWHAANNFVGNIRTAEAYAWNRKTGLINQAYFNAD